MRSRVPELRVGCLRDTPPDPDGRYVLYWMIAARRTRSNFGLQRAVEWARELKCPLLVLEALSCDYRWAADRHHRFVLDGMAANRKRFDSVPVTYFPYVEPEPGAGNGLLAHLAASACVVVTDLFPCFGLDHMVEKASRAVSTRMEAVDSNGLLPLAAADRVYPTAHAFRRMLQRELRPHLDQPPVSDPLARLRLPELGRLPNGTVRWPRASDTLLYGDPSALSRLPIDHDVPPAPLAGGQQAALEALERFVECRLDAYADDRNHPDEGATSGLSPYLHFGHLGAHEFVWSVLDREDWTPDRLARSAAGSRRGWWGLGESAEALLDQVVTWRELGFNAGYRSKDHEGYASLPEWARRTLDDHADDPRDPVYTLSRFERAATHDEVWNAAQRQLAGEGVIHNYLRMLWGKKILHWSRSPREALKIMIELNNKYALDGRDPNSYSGIFWVLGRYDRAWGPERPIFGKIRYMTSENTLRKLRMREYLARHGPLTAGPS